MEQTRIFAWIWPIIVTALYAVAVVELRRRLVDRFTRSGRTRGTLGEELTVRFLGWPIAILAVLGGMVLLFGLWPVNLLHSRFVLGAARLALIAAAAAFAHEALRSGQAHSPEGSLLASPGAAAAALGSIYSFAALLALQALGVEVLPAVLLLGFVLFVLTFALPEALGNLIAGAYLAWGRAYEPGEVIAVDGGEPSRIESIDWTHTKVADARGARTIVPNRKLLAAEVERLGRADAEIPLELLITLDPQSPLEKARKSALTVARSVLRENKALAGKAEPELSIQALSAMGIELKLRLAAKDFAATAPLRDAYLTALSKRFSTEKIQFGYG